MNNSKHKVEVRILVTLKTFHGIFKPKLTRHEFWFCAESPEIAAKLASRNVKSQGYPYDETMVQVLDAIPLATGTQLKSCREVKVEQEELAWLVEQETEAALREEVMA
jgi:hypothetical protein